MYSLLQTARTARSSILKKANAKKIYFANRAEDNRLFKGSIETTDDFRYYGKEMIDMIADYHDNVASLPVVPDVKPGYIRDLLPSKPPENPQSFEKIIDTLNKAVVPGLTQWHSPQFHAYYPVGNSYPSLLGGLLGEAIGSVAFSWSANPACTELEMVTIDWFAEMLDLPKHFLHSSEGNGGGVIQTSASESVLVTLLAAKARVLKQENVDSQKLVLYCSEEAHSSIERAAKLTEVSIKKIKTDKQFCMDAQMLKHQIMEDVKNGLVPVFVAGTLGTTSVCSFDNIDEIGSVCKEFPNVWLHIDAAYAGNALICPELRNFSKGIEHTDSFSVNFSKWMMVYIECSGLYMRDTTHFVDSYNVDPLYLKHDFQNKVPDFRHWQIPLSKTFRSLKLWMVLMSYGKIGLQRHIRNHIRLAKHFEEVLALDSRFEIFHDVTMGIVCFRLVGDNEINEKLHRNINAAANIHLSPANVKNKFVIRFVVGSRLTEIADIDFALKEIKSHADALGLKTCQMIK